MRHKNVTPCVLASGLYYRLHWRCLLRCVAILLLLILACPAVLCAEDATLASNANEVIDSRKWTEVNLPETIRILGMLATQTKGNYEKIHTWRGTCSVHSREELSLQRSKENLQKYIDKQINAPYAKDSIYKTEFAIDLAANASFQCLRDAKLTWVDTSSGKSIAISQTKLVTGNAVITPAEFIHFDPTHKYSEFLAVQGNPEAMSKRAAFREPPEVAKRYYYPGLEPHRFFLFSNSTPFWKGVQSFQRSLKGEDGSERQKKCVEATRVYESSDANGRWFRTDFKMEGPLGSLIEVKIWGPNAGMNPVSFSVWKGGVGHGHNMIYEASWEYAEQKGIHIPVSFKEISYANGTCQSAHSVKFDSSILNEPIDPSQFSYKGLGMKDGDLVMDRIESVCYILKNSKPIKLANFNEKYVPPGERTSMTRWILIVGGLVLLAVGVISSVRRLIKAKAA